jgi:hypothetical protein
MEKSKSVVESRRNHQGRKQGGHSPSRASISPEKSPRAKPFINEERIDLKFDRKPNDL